MIICNVKKGIEITRGKTGPYSKPAVTERVLLGSCNSPSTIENGETGTQLRDGQNISHQ